MFIRVYKTSYFLSLISAWRSAARQAGQPGAGGCAAGADAGFSIRPADTAFPVRRSSSNAAFRSAVFNAAPSVQR